MLTKHMSIFGGINRLGFGLAVFKSMSMGGTND